MHSVAQEIRASIDGDEWIQTGFATRRKWMFCLLVACYCAHRLHKRHPNEAKEMCFPSVEPTAIQRADWLPVDRTI